MGVTFCAKKDFRRKWPRVRACVRTCDEMGPRPIYLFIQHIYIYYYSDEIKPDPPTHTHNPSLGFLPARRVRKPSLVSPLLPPATPAAPSSSPLMSAAPATGKRLRDADSDGELLDDLPESGAYHPPTLHLTAPLPPQHRPGSSRPPR